MPQAANELLGYTEGMENMAFALFLCGMGAFGVATFLMSRGARSRSSI